MLELLISACLVASALSGAHAESAPNCYAGGKPAENSIISLEVPPPHERDPDKCEPYETERDVEHKCTKSCSFDGNIGRYIFQGEPPRTVSQCVAAGRPCKLNLATHSQLNVSSGGRCNGKCRCVSVDEYDSAIHLDKPHTPAGSPNRSCHRVHSGTNHFASLKLHIPVNECRSQTACEHYERRSLVACKHFCKVYGNLGSLALEGKPRSLATSDRDGDYCELMFHDEKEISLKGVDQIQTGRCVGGVCRPQDWIKPTDHVSSAPTPTPTAATVEDVTFRLEINNDLVKGLKDNSNQINTNPPK